MTVKLATRVMRARRTGTCPVCHGPIHVGELIAKTGFWQHIQHVIDHNRQAIGEGQRP
ncbi:MAG: hypothetical protein ACLP52_11230 [Streptosporangiaceae bacterium]